MERHDVARVQFGARASAYVASAVHATGEDLLQLAALVAARNGARVLDLGCGGGHATFAVAPHAAQVVAYDISEAMLAAAAEAARARGLANVETRRGPAELLPFPDGAFDVVVTRFSAHHWYDLPAALREAHRVLDRDGQAAFVDVVAPPAASLDTFLQAVELLRDGSHVRDYAEREWLDALRAAGFAVTAPTYRRLRLEFESWIARMQTPQPHVRAIRSLEGAAARDVLDHFAIEPDGSFTVDTATFVAAYCR